MRSAKQLSREHVWPVPVNRLPGLAYDFASAFMLKNDNVMALISSEAENEEEN